MRPAVVVVVILIAVAGSAHAGICLDDDEDEAAVKTLEKVAAGKTKASEAEYAVLCARALARLAPRMEAACTTILEAHPPVKLSSKLDPMDPDDYEAIAVNSLAWECADAMAWRGHATAGTFDVLALYLGSDHGLGGNTGRDNAAALAHIDDPAARAEIIERYGDYRDQLAAKKPTASKAHYWSKWQVAVLGGLGRTATAAERDFLASIADTTTDKRVKTAAKRALDALDRRTAAP